MKTCLRPGKTARKIRPAPACADGQKSLSALCFLFVCVFSMPWDSGFPWKSRERPAKAGMLLRRGREAGAEQTGRGCSGVSGVLGSEHSRTPGETQAPLLPGRPQAQRLLPPLVADSTRVRASRLESAQRGTPAPSRKTGAAVPTRRGVFVMGGGAGRRNTGQGLQSSSTAQNSVSSPFRGPLGGHSASPLGRQQGARRSLSAGVPEQARRTLPAGPAAAAKRISSPPGADKTRGSWPGAEPAGAGLSRFPHLPRLRCHHSPAEKTKQTPHRTEKAARTRSWDVQNGLRAVPGTTPGWGPSSLAGCGAAEATHVPRVRLPRREGRRAVHPASVPDAWTATG